MKISTVSEMREMDRTAIERFGIHEELLMENAGYATYQVIRNHIGIKNKEFIVFCGIGNNGGDGFVISRKIHSDGGIPKVYILGTGSKYKGAAKKNLDIISKLPIKISLVDSLETVQKELAHCDAVVDAIFGTGLTRNIEGVYEDIVHLINKCGKPVISADIPSGINGENGTEMGISVKADFTVAFGLPKVGNMLYPGFERCGKIYVSHISFPTSLYKSDMLNISVNNPKKLPDRNPYGHKGTFGNVLFIAGANYYYGAPMLSAMSFLKAGGGYSLLAAPQSITPYISCSANEVVFIPQKETATGSVSLENKNVLVELSKKADMVVLGPGLSVNKETGQLVRELSEEIQKPMLIDGDGITSICADLNCIRNRKYKTVLTPHMGEMIRITGKNIEDIQSDPIGILQKTAMDLNSIIVFKGAHTLIGLPDMRVLINFSGNPGMGTAGSGDVLTGTIAAMFGLGLELDEAVKKGVFIHGLAGDLASDDIGEDGVTARDIMNYLPKALKIDRQGLPQHMIDKYSGAIVI